MRGKSRDDNFNLRNGLYVILVAVQALQRGALKRKTPYLKAISMPAP
jgi:hypothetical protein